MHARLTRRLLLSALAVLLVAGGISATSWLQSQRLRDAQLAAAKAGFSLSASPSNLNVPAGTQGSYAVTITRSGFSGAVAFSVTSDLPPNSTATFAPTSTTGNSATLYIATSSNTTLGSYNPVITGTASTGSVSTTVHLTVSAGQSKQFAISGSLDRALAPGVTGNLDLSLTNPNNQGMTVSGLSVAIAQVSKAGCSASNNFSIRQFTGSVAVPANSTWKLSQLGVTALPQVTMVDLPVNQDVCKGVTLTLTYTGTGTG